MVQTHGYVRIAESPDMVEPEQHRSMLITAIAVTLFVAALAAVAAAVTRR